MPEQSQNLPAAAVSRQPCADPKRPHDLNCRSLRLPNEPNPNAGDFCPGFGICDCHVSEIERLQLALRIAVEEIQGLGHGEMCDYLTCIRCQVRHTRSDKDHSPELMPCNCGIASTLARIDAAKTNGVVTE